MKGKRALGETGERLAESYLERKGFVLLERNFYAQRCEIDLIMRDGETTVFVEVKARSSTRYGLGREAVTKQKQLNLLRAATAYAAQNGLMETSLRFDVAEVELNRGTVTHIENAFQA